MDSRMILYVLLFLVLLYLVYSFTFPQVRPQADADQKSIQGMSLMTSA